MESNEYRVGIHQLFTFVKELSNSLVERDMTFPEMFENYNEYHEVVSTGKLERYYMVRDWIEKGSTVLDVGIGDGLISERLIKEKEAVIKGLDISDLACYKARTRGINAMVRDINHGLGLSEDEYYDYILLMEVIEHTLYPQRILADAANHSQKGVIVTIPNSAYIKWRIQLLRGYSPRQSFTHLHYWSIKDFEILCRELRLDIIGFRTPLPSWLMGLKNLLGWQQCWLIAPSKDH